MARSCASQSGCILCHRSNDDPSLARRVRSLCTRWGCLASFTVLRSQGRPGNWNGQEIFLQGKKAICELTVTRSLYRPTNICASKTDTAGTAQVPWLLRALEIRSSCLKGSSSWQSRKLSFWWWVKNTEPSAPFIPPNWLYIPKAIW